MAIKAYTEDLVPAVKDFNSRLDAGRAPEEFRFPEHHIPYWLPRVGQRRVYQEYFLCVANGAVRGCYMLKHQDFSFYGEIRCIGFFHWPISEGVINKKYGWVAPQMLSSALKAQPMLYCLGMGGYEGGPLPQMLKALGWTMDSVPFHFKVICPRRFLKEMQALRKSRLQGLLMDIAAKTGTGGLALKILQSVRVKRCSDDEQVEGIRAFSRWAEDLWNQCKGRYAMIAVRDSETLNILYPPTGQRFLCFKVIRGSQILGWVVLLDTPMRGNKYFGNLRVGSIVDCLALPENACSVVRAATRVLEGRGVDLIVSNQSHACWSTALRSAGFLQGPSNYLLAISQELTKLLQPLQIKMAEVHLTRGDGDGPIHL